MPINADRCVAVLTVNLTRLEAWVRDHFPNPLDHNAECIFCDEQGEHAPECPWGEEKCPHGKNVAKFGPCGWCERGVTAR